MAISEQEAQAVYETLAASASEARLFWVLAQVEETLSIGKVSLKKVSVRDYPAVYEAWAFGEEGGGGRRPSSAMFVVSAEYSAQERLQVLIEALLAAVPAVHEIAHAAIGTLSSLGETTSLQFTPEVGVKDSFNIDADLLGQKRDGARRLRELLQELLQEVADGASPNLAF